MSRTLHALIVLLIGTIRLASAPVVVAHPLAGAPDCPIFPADNPWNQRVDHARVARNSAEMIQAIGLGTPIHAAFGSGTWDGSPIGIPFSVVSNKTPSYRIRMAPSYVYWGTHSTYPLTPWLPSERSSNDHHLIVVNRDTCKDYELFGAQLTPSYRWDATIGVVFDLRSDKLRPLGWTSADAAGLPILPGLARYDEVASGSIDHALRFTAPSTRRAWIYPARHFGGGSSSRALPPMGLRVRLKASVNISRLPRQARVIARALKRYGMILADNGPAWYVSGAPDDGWNNDQLRALGQLTGSDFQAVDTNSLPRVG